MKLFLVFLSNSWCAIRNLTEYLQLSRLDFIHFILMHSQTSQFQFHVKINSQEYSNPIPRDFEPMITHQVPIPWILNNWNHALNSRVLRLLMNHALSLDTSSIRHSISVLTSKDIFQHLKNTNHAWVAKPKQALSMVIKY